MDPLQRLHRSIRACTRCADAGYIPVARPVVAGKLSDRIAIIGQAPGVVELTSGQPFSGRSGAILRRWLADAGISENELPYRTAITKWFIAAPFLLGGATTASTWNDMLAGAALIVLSLPRGSVGERYGGWQRFIR